MYEITMRKQTEAWVLLKLLIIRLHTYSWYGGVSKKELKIQ